MVIDLRCAGESRPLQLSGHEMLSDIFQRQYDFEHQRRGEVTSAAGSPIVAVTVLSSALAVALLDFPYAQSALTGVFAMFVVATLSGLAATVYYIFRSIWSHIYKKLPSAPTLSEYFKELKAWHLSRHADASNVSVAAERDFREFVNERLSEAADWNGQTNDRRGNFLHMGTTALAIALALFVPTALLYAYAKATSPEKVHRVVLTQAMTVKETNVTTNQNTGTSTSTTAVKPSAPASAPAASQIKPIGPSNSTFRTNTEIPSPQANSSRIEKSGE